MLIIISYSRCGSGLGQALASGTGQEQAREMLTGGGRACDWRSGVDFGGPFLTWYNCDMVVFDWLKEWANVLTFVSAFLIAGILWWTENRHRKSERALAEVDTLMIWVKNVCDLTSQFFTVSNDDDLNRLTATISGLITESLTLDDIARKRGVSKEFGKVSSDLGRFSTLLLPIRSIKDKALMPVDAMGDINLAGIAFLFALAHEKSRI